MREVALDPDMGRLGPEARRILIAPDGQQQVDRLVAQPGQDGLEDPGVRVEDGAQAGMDGRPRREILDPGGSASPSSRSNGTGRRNRTVGGIVSPDRGRTGGKHAR